MAKVGLYGLHRMIVAHEAEATAVTTVLLYLDSRLLEATLAVLHMCQHTHTRVGFYHSTVPNQCRTGRADGGTTNVTVRRQLTSRSPSPPTQVHILYVDGKLKFPTTYLQGTVSPLEGYLQPHCQLCG